jgi:UDP-glucose 4-epimerase
MKNRNVLLIGGGGFIGTALAPCLTQKKFNVHILSRHYPLWKIEPNMIFHQGSLDDRELLERILPECPTIVHLASATTPGSSARAAMIEVEKNIVPTLGFLDILQSYKPFHLIFVSSGGTLYGNPDSTPVDESHPLKPLSFHGAGKVAIETFLKTFATLPGKNITIARPSNIYGPGQLLRPGFGVIRTMLEHLYNGTAMEIWGDGMAVRDFLYIDDMVTALMHLVDLPHDNDTYNIGSGMGYNLNQIKEIIESVCDKKLTVNYRPGRQTDVKNIVLDSTQFIKKTNWHPTVSLKQGINFTWEWLNHK